MSSARLAIATRPPQPRKEIAKLATILLYCLAGHGTHLLFFRAEHYVRPDIFPNDDAIVRLVGAILLEQNDEWAVQRARYMTLGTISR